MVWQEQQRRIQSAISECGSYRLTRWYGLFSAAYALKCLIENPTGGVVSGGSTLFDFREAMIELSFDGAEHISRSIESLQRPHRDSAAFLVSNDLAFGLARMYEITSAAIFERTLVARELDEVPGFISMDEDVFRRCEALLEEIELPAAD